MNDVFFCAKLSGILRKEGVNLARSSKSVVIMSKNLTYEERQARLNTETKLKGKADELKSPAHLNNNQKSKFQNFILQIFYEKKGACGVAIFLKSLISIRGDL